MTHHPSILSWKSVIHCMEPACMHLIRKRLLTTYMEQWISSRLLLVAFIMNWRTWLHLYSINNLLVSLPFEILTLCKPWPVLVRMSNCELTLWWSKEVSLVQCIVVSFVLILPPSYITSVRAAFMRNIPMYLIEKNMQWNSPKPCGCQLFCDVTGYPLMFFFFFSPVT